MPVVTVKHPIIIRMMCNNISRSPLLRCRAFLHRTFRPPHHCGHHRLRVHNGQLDPWKVGAFQIPDASEYLVPHKFLSMQVIYLHIAKT